jgi:hypothetical protein
MNTKSCKTLSISVNHNRLALIFILGKQPVYWELSYAAACNPKRAAEKVSYWINFYEADCIITEDIRGGSRKGRRTQALLKAIIGKLNSLKVQHILVPRYQPFQSKYEQMEYLCDKYPQLNVLAIEKRKYWQNELPYVSYFEAMSMADRYMSVGKETEQLPHNLPV